MTSDQFQKVMDKARSQGIRVPLKIDSMAEWGRLKDICPDHYIHSGRCACISEDPKDGE